MKCQPMSTAPLAGEILVADYSPTNWKYMVRHVILHPEMNARRRELDLRYARAWMPVQIPPGDDLEHAGGD